MLQTFYQKTGKWRKLLAKGAILYGAGLLILYTVFRAYYINFSPNFAFWAVLLFIAEFHTIVLLVGFLYSLWPRDYKKYDIENLRRDQQINMFITVCGEPTKIVRKTIEHAKAAADYYNKKVDPISPARVVVLNDGRGAKKDNWQEIEKVAKETGVYHIARESNTGFKAGNINNGLAEFPAEDPHKTIDCFIDADFAVKPHFVMELTKPMLDDEVDFVQSPQRYQNENTWVAQAAGAHQIFFFDYICPAKAYDNALFLCGTNYAIRREALLNAGGVDHRFVTEDYATSIKLHLNNNKGVFVPDVLAEGYAPMNLKEYFNQQMRWCKGCLDANGKYIKELFFGPLNWRQKFHYFLSTAYYFIGIRDLILVLAPLPYLIWGTSLIRANTLSYLGYVYVPYVVYNFALFFLTFRYPFKSLVLDIVSFPVFAKAFISSFIGHNLPFTVTIKKYQKENPFKVYRVQLAVAIILSLGIIYSLLFQRPDNIGGYINYFWASYSTSFLLLGFWLVILENINLKISFEYEPIRKVAQNARVLAFMILAFTSGITLPLAYTTAAKTTPVQNVLSTVNLDTKEELLVPNESVYYGYYKSEFNSHPSDFTVGQVAGEQPSLAMYYEDWNPDSDFNTGFMNRLSDKGVIPVVTWEPYDTKDEDSVLNIDGAPQEMIINGEYDEYIRKWAIAAKRYRKPFYLRFAHEMNGNWYPWGNINEDSSEKYKAMWIHVHNIFEEVGADNVIWTWTPNNTDQYGVTDGVLDYYPGDNYVDWVGYSAFNWGDTNYKKSLWRKFTYMSWDIYNELSELNKPIMVAETSSVSSGGNKQTWFLETLGGDIPYLENIKAVVIFDDNYNNSDFNLDDGINYRFVHDSIIKDSSFFRKSPIISTR